MTEAPVKPTVELPPDVALIRDALDYDPATGVFRWRNPAHAAWKGLVAGRANSNGYMRVTISRREFLCHRAAWMHHYGTVPGIVDHINGDRSDNRIANLRLADLAENNWNCAKRHEPRGFGKQPKGGRFYALIRHRGKRLYLGTFDTEAEAAAAYQAAARNLRGEFHA